MSLSPENLLEKLTECCKFYQEHPEEEEGHEMNLPQLWQTLVNVAQNDLVLLGKFYPQLNILAEYDAEFTETQPECITTLITKLTESSRSSEDRKKYMRTLSRLLPFFNQDNSCKTFQGIIELCNRLMSKEKNLPDAIIDNFKEIITTNMDAEVIAKIFNTIQANMKTKRAAATLVLACFAETITESIGLAEEMVGIAGDALDGDSLEMQAGCVLLSKIAPSLSNIDEDSLDPDDLIEMIVPAIYDDDEDVISEGINAFTALAKNGVILSDSCSRKFIREFNNFNTPDLLPYFFKCLRIIVNANIEVQESEDANLEEEEFDEDPEKDNTHEEEAPEDEEDNDEEDDDKENAMESIIPIRDFTVSALKATEDTNILSGCIRTLADITNASDSLMKNVRKDVRARVFSLLDKKTYSLFPAISYFLKASFENSNLSATGRLAQRLRLILHGAKKPETAPLKQRMKCVRNISAFARAVRFSLIESVYVIGIDALSNADDEIACLGADIIGNIARSLKIEQIKKSLDLMQQKALSCKLFGQLENYMKQLTQVMTNKSLVSSDIEPVLVSLLENKPAALNGIPLNQANPLCVESFRFINSCIKFDKGSKCVSYLLNLLKTSTKETSPEVIKIGISALEKNLIPSQTLKEFAAIVQKLLNNAEIEESDLLIQASDFIRIAYVKDKTSCTPSDTFKHIDEIVDDIADDDEEEEEDADEDDEQYSEQVVAMGLMVFTVYLHDTSLRVSRSLLRNLMDLLVITSDDPHIPPIVTSIILMYNAGDRFQCIRNYSLETFADIVSMDPNDLDELDLRDEDEKQMKQIIKDVVKKDPLIVSKLTGDFSNKEDKMKRFYALIQ